VVCREGLERGRGGNSRGHLRLRTTSFWLGREKAEVAQGHAANQFYTPLSLISPLTP
jgi:hypothetical protein